MTATGHQTSTIIQAVESAWQVIQEKHPDVPDVAVAMGSGTMARGLKLGHFAADRWNRDGGKIPELFVSGEGFTRGATDVFGTLLHEAAHGLAFTREIADTSRRGKYHNKKFKALAEEMGLDCAQAGTIGWSATTVRASTALDYAGAIHVLDEALKLTRVSEQRSEGKKDKDRNLIPVSCECGRKIRVSQGTLEMGGITCNVCDSEFAPAAA